MTITNKWKPDWKAAVAAALLLSGCGGNDDTPAFNIGGTVSGLSGSGLKITNNGSETVAISANGSFTFVNRISSGAAYAVSVTAQPSQPSQTCAVTNGSGLVAAASITNIAIVCTSNTSYAVGGTVRGLSLSKFTTGAVLQLNGANDLALAANGTFNFSGLIPDGGSYAVTVKTQPAKPAQTCTVIAGSGTVKSGAITNVEITCAGNAARFVYVTNDGSIAAYSIGPGGTLAPTQTIPDSHLPVALAVDPSGQFLYVADQLGGAGIGSISTFSIDQTTGMLAQVGSAITESFTPKAIVVDPSNSYVFVANIYGGATSQGSVTVFQIDPATGALAVVDTDDTDNHNPSGIAIDPSGQYVYTSNLDGSVGAFAVDPQSGHLSLVAASPFAAGNVPGSIAVDPNGKFVYVVNDSTTAGISAYGIDPSTGVLQPLNGSPFSVLGAGLVAMDPLGRFFYIASFTGVAGSLPAYSVDPVTGVVSAIKGSPFAQGIRPVDAVVDPSGATLFVLNIAGPGTGTLAEYAIDGATGILTELSGSPYIEALNPTAVAVD
jgi:6-phosphogluconolactonase